MKLLKLLPRFDASEPNLGQGTNAAGNAESTGNTALSSYDPTQASGAAEQNSNDLFNTQQGQTNNYVNQYAQSVAANPTVTSLYNTANNMFNVPQLSQQATNLNNRVNNIVPAGYAGARGFDIDNTDINNGDAAASAYLTPQANQANANYNAASGLASQYVQAGQAQNAQNLLPVQAEAPLLQQQQATQGTIWNTATSAQLQGLMQKMESGVSLSSAELGEAQSLIAAEQAYENTGLAQQYQAVPSGSNLVNTFTGSIQPFK